MALPLRRVQQLFHVLKVKNKVQRDRVVQLVIRERALIVKMALYARLVQSIGVLKSRFGHKLPPGVLHVRKTPIAHLK
jgi:hypothetical protein